MEKLYFIVGSQDLYGEECLKQVAVDAAEMVRFLNEQLKSTIEIELLPVVQTSKSCLEDMRKVQTDDSCVGVIIWLYSGKTEHSA